MGFKSWLESQQSLVRKVEKVIGVHPVVIGVIGIVVVYVIMPVENHQFKSQLESQQSLKESGEGHYCRYGCHWEGYHCVCPHASGEPSVQKLVSAGLELLKAGKTLKFNE